MEFGAICDNNNKKVSPLSDCVAQDFLLLKELPLMLAGDEKEKENTDELLTEMNF